MANGKKDEEAPDILRMDIKAGGEFWGIINALPHNFKTGSTGFYGTGKIVNPENPRALYQVGVNITLIGSKPRE
jgi:hypothetical protein